MSGHLETTLELLRSGGLCIVQDDPSREDEGDFVALGAAVSYDSLHAMISRGQGLVCVPLGPELARRWNLEPMVRHNHDPHGTAFTVSVDAGSAGTGISVADRLKTIRLLAAGPEAGEGLRSPGHVFPLVARPGGLEERRGHTEAAIELARLCGGPECAVICEILAPDGTMLRGAALRELAASLQVPLLGLDEILSWSRRAAGARLPTEAGDFELFPLPMPPESVLLALDPARALAEGSHPDGPLCRIHSECLTGDIFGSLRCDCGPQLHRSLELLRREGRGLLFYLRQEGRGIGLHQKLAAYRLQDRGLDTLDANRALGHPADGRDYAPVAAWLKARGVRRLRLLTNNPGKLAALRAWGLEVVRVPLWLEGSEHSRSYLDCKKDRFGHLD